MSLRETLERIRSNPTPANEETAKFQILAPILADLSSDPFGQEVRWRPVAVLLRGERHPVRSHVEILTTVVEELHRRRPHDFDQAAEALRAGQWQYVSRDRQRVYGTRIKQTAAGHFVNVNLSARNIRKRSVRLMEALGYRESDLEYVYE